MATDIRIKYSIDTDDIAKAQSEFDKLTKEEQDALSELKKINVEIGKVGDEADDAKKKLKDTFNEGKKGAKSAGEGIGSLNGIIGKFAGLAAGAFSIGALVSFGKAALDVTGRFQSLEAVLRNTLGSDSAAQGALIRIKEIAATTPFSVEELTASFVKLANQGFKPTNQQIIALGDLAASTGKSFDQLAEALIDAQVGEFERLKEFGIRAAKQGDQVKFTFKGVETTVQNSSRAIQDYIVSLGGMQGVMGAMGSQSATLEGAVSNLGDAWDSFLLSIGDRLGPIYQAAIKVTSAFLSTLKDLFQTDEGKLKERQGKSYNEYTQQFTKISDEALKNVEQNSFNRIAIEENETKRLEQELQKRRKEAEKARTQIVGGGSIAGMGAATTFDPEKTFDVKEAEKALAKQKRLVTDFKAMNQAAIDSLVARAEAKKQADKDADAAAAASAAKAEKLAKEQEAANNKAYSDAVRQVELDKQIEQEKIKLTETGQSLSRSMQEAEMAANVKIYEISKEYADKNVQTAKDKAKVLPAIIATQNKEITDSYIKEGEASIAAFKKQLEAKQKAQEDSARKLNESNLAAIDKRAADSEADLEAEAIKMGEVDDNFKKKQIQNQIDFNNERIAENDRAANEGVVTALTANDAIINENKKLQAQLIAIDKETQKKKQEVMLAGVDLAAQITSQSFALYQENLNAELNSIAKRYDEEIRLADGNKQKITELNEKRAAEEKEIKKKQFYAQRMEAIAQVVFNTAPIIAQYGAAVFTAPLALIALAAQAAQIGFILAQPVPEFAEGTKGRKFRGGRAMVGEKGTEKIITESGKVYFTPPTATLMDLPKGAQVVPNHLLSKQEIAYASMGKNIPSGSSFDLGGKLTEIGGILKGLPIHQIVMDEKGFQKFIKTENRTTKVLNNKFPQAYS